MFTEKVTVPRITKAQVAQFESIAPGVSKMVKVPLIETTEQAVIAATDLINSQLTGYEYVLRAEDVVETETGWNITLICAGD